MNRSHFGDSAGVRMNADNCNGRSYVSGSGDSSMEREFSGGLGGPTMSTLNSQHSSPSRSLSANSIKVELYSDDDPGSALRPQGRGGEREEGWKEEREEKMEGEEEEGQEEAGGEGASPKTSSPGPIRLPNGKLKCDVCGMICIGPNVLMVHKRSHTGERPFKCNQCGASFTQKGNLLRHIKLHSGEKPFKCPYCSYACRRRDALTGHLRTHSMASPIVGKPYKCSYCGRNYKQQSSLEEHRERCHSYQQSLESQSSHTQGEDLELMQDPLIQSPFIDRLANSITKRKRTTPQKFVGEKHMHLNMADTPYELNPTLDKVGDALGPQHQGVDSAHFAGVGGEYLSGQSGGSGGPEPRRSLRLPHPHVVTCLSELTPVISSIYGQLGSLGPRGDCAGGGAGLGGVVSGLGGREVGEGHEDLPHLGHSHAQSPGNSCQGSTDSESMAGDQCGIAVGNSNHHHHPHYPPAPPPPPPPPPPPQQQPRGRDRRSPALAKERDWGEPERDEAHPAAAPPGSPGSWGPLRLLDGEGQPVRCYRCEHCRILFLDHVMFTIHMGCHGFRQPFECNICGHRSADRYEFSSHIVRGEHTLG
ncbi:zinc finger protein Eos-like isoform X1 [Anguilla anguilla]|uniref:zinc finger protein Eos-like isoform X1 n=2 Tax=Anguilla anguilla TaxID=7936 RepID=UPI0015AE9829|nr:zinc finger protein Eos-like isoform X1 [Anguilla anguilla]XP_035238625.1 zinc finger protein Eos-like isoform X1 [Anguilla anguilla]